MTANEVAQMVTKSANERIDQATLLMQSCGESFVIAGVGIHDTLFRVIRGELGESIVWPSGVPKIYDDSKLAQRHRMQLDITETRVKLKVVKVSTWAAKEIADLKSVIDSVANNL